MVAGDDRSSLERIHAYVVRARRPVQLEEVARAVGLTKSPTHGHLNRLVRDGWLERVRDAGEVRYLPRQHLRIEWTHLEEAQGAYPQRWFHQSWSRDEVDWRFPLVSRIPDGDARTTVLRFLEAAWNRGCFQPWLRHESAPGPRDHEGFTAVVFGACARGQAHPDSDVDTLLIQPSSQDGRTVDEEETFLSLADEINLGAPRYLDLFVVQRDGHLPDRLEQEIVRDGITVFTTFPGGEFVEDWRWHREVVDSMPGSDGRRDP